jgi:hypothetical protein
VRVLLSLLAIESHGCMMFWSIHVYPCVRQCRQRVGTPSKAVVGCVAKVIHDSALERLRGVKTLACAALEYTFVNTHFVGLGVKETVMCQYPHHVPSPDR